MTPFFSSLRFRLLAIVFFAALPALGVIIYSSLEQRHLAKDSAGKEILNKVLTIANFQKRVFEEAQNELAILAEFPPIRDQQTGPCSAVLANFLRKNPEYANLGVADGSGKIFCSALPMEKTISVANRLYFQEALKNREFAVGSYQVGLISGKISIGMGFPVENLQGTVGGVIFAALDLKWLQKILAEGANNLFSPQTTITVIDQEGIILARWPQGELWVGTQNPDVDIIRTVLTEGEGITEAHGLDRVHKLFAFSRLDRSRQIGFIYAGIPTSALYAELNRTLARNLIVLGIIISSILIAAWVLSSQLVLQRLGRLLNAARRISAGDLSARTGLAYGKGEIDHLARSFDEMAGELQRRAEEVEFTNKILVVANQSRSLDELLAGFITEIKSFSRCASVGVRILRNNGSFPFQTNHGPSPGFFDEEKGHQVGNNGPCICLKVIRGEIDSRLPYYSEYGSFYVNGLSRLQTGDFLEKESLVRRLCLEPGYESCALVPLRVGNQTLGLIRLADGKEGMVPLRLVEELEKGGMRLGQALKRLQAEENIRALSHELMQAQEQERQKISRELHDSVAQELAALKIGVENLGSSSLGKPGEEADTKISELLHLLQRTLTSVRVLSYDLRPPDLEHLGLVSAIKLHCEEFAARTGIQVDFRAAGMEAAPLGYEAAINLYRIIQEGLTNVWRHAQATVVNIRLVASFPKIILRLEDNGKGFDVSGEEGRIDRGNRLGLLGMRERVSFLGGEMKVDSQPQKGTRISIEIPWKEEDHGSNEEALHS
jgi:signal transduction histidine kinase